MRQILILRHAKAVPHGSRPTDYDRELAERGHEQMSLVGGRLAGQLPEHTSITLYTSPATRTKETAELFIKALSGCRPVLTPAPDLWDTDAGQYLATLTRALKETPADHVLAIVGHNPMISQLAGGLTDRRIELGTSGYLLLGFHDEDPDALDMLGHNTMTLIDEYRVN